MTPLKLHGSVRMRSIQTGTTKWKEGTFEIVDKESKVILVIHYNAGGIPKIFPVSSISGAFLFELFYLFGPL